MPNIKGHQLPDKPFRHKSAGTGSAADIATKDVYVQQIVCTNPTGGSLTFTLADKHTTPWEFANAQVVAINSAYVAQFDPPILFKSGISLNAPTGMDVQIVGLTEYA